MPRRRSCARLHQLVGRRHLRGEAHHPDPFERARTRLLLGSRLRREGQRVSAREQLVTAREAFERRGLTHWSDRAAAELRATGARVSTGAPGRD